MLKALLAGVMVVLTAAFGVVAWISLRPPPAPPVQEQAAAPLPSRVAVLVAARAIGPGSLLKPDDVATLDMPSDAMPADALADGPANRADLTGAMVRHPLVPQRPILPSDVVRPGDGGFLAAVLSPGRRAVSVAVDAVSGTAGLIWPGDHVDIILTQTLEDQAMPAGRRTFGETVLRDVRVIAVDQQLARGASPDGVPPGSRTVTLETSPAAAERIAVAVRLGRIALSVRPASNGEAAEDVVASLKPGGAVPTTWGQDVSPALVKLRPSAGGTVVRVYQGAAADKEFKFE